MSPTVRLTLPRERLRPPEPHADIFLHQPDRTHLTSRSAESATRAAIGLPRRPESGRETEACENHWHPKVGQAARAIFHRRERPWNLLRRPVCPISARAPEGGGP